MEVSQKWNIPVVTLWNTETCLRLWSPKGTIELVRQHKCQQAEYYKSGWCSAVPWWPPCGCPSNLFWIAFSGLLWNSPAKDVNNWCIMRWWAFLRREDNLPDDHNPPIVAHWGSQVCLWLKSALPPLHQLCWKPSMIHMLPVHEKPHLHHQHLLKL